MKQFGLIGRLVAFSLVFGLVIGGAAVSVWLSASVRGELEFWPPGAVFGAFILAIAVFSTRRNISQSEKPRKNKGELE